MKKRDLALLWGAAFALIGCGSDDDGDLAFQELYDQGLTQYVDQFDPVESVQKQGGSTQYNFAVPDDPSAEPRGPICLRGAGFNVQTREGSAEELVIFLEGGGACWDTFCQANTEPGELPAPDSGAGILDPMFPDNPVADWDVVFIPYCDGSLFAGDIDRILPAPVLEPGEPSQGYQRGLQNLTAALDVAVEAFPNPTRILVTGVSAGGFGTVTALPLVRYYYRDAEIILFNDSGVGVVNGNDRSFLTDLVGGWNAVATFPESCVDCSSNGHATRLIEWQLAADPNYTMSVLSYSQDSVVADFFFGVGGEAFEAELLAETDITAAAFPDRYKRFIPVGTAHTALLSPSPLTVGLFQIGGLDETIDGTTVLDHLTAQIEGSEAWVDRVDGRLTAQ